MATSEPLDSFEDLILQAFPRKKLAPPQQSHLSADVLAAALAGELPPDVQERVRIHLALCQHCAHRYEELEEEIKEDQAAMAVTTRFPTLSEFYASKPTHKLRRWLESFLQYLRPESRTMRVALASGVLSFVAVAICIAILLPQVLLLERREAKLTAFNDRATGQIQSLEEELRGKDAQLAQVEQELATLQEGIPDSITLVGSRIVAVLPGESFAWLEGGSVLSVIEITVNKPLTEYLRISETIDDRILFDGLAEKGRRIIAIGERLEVTWDTEDGLDALTVRGWREAEWTEQGLDVAEEARVLQESDIVRLGNKNVIVFP
jgi:hypothetical protein